MDRIDNNVQGVIKFPCHSKEKVLVYEGTHGYCSIKCPACDKFALFNFDTMKSKTVRAVKGAIHNIKEQNKYID